jgi:hypothetical protein
MRKLLLIFPLLLLVFILSACLKVGEVTLTPTPSLPWPETPLPWVPGVRAIGGYQRIVPGEYVAWGVPTVAVPPTRRPDDPLYPGNHILGLDCLTYLGSGGGVSNAVWDDYDQINWQPCYDCLDGAAARTVKLPSGDEVPQPVSLVIPPSFMDPGGAGTPSNPYIKLHKPAWMSSDYTFQFTADGHTYQSFRYDTLFKEAMIEFVEAAGTEFDANPQVSLVRLYVGYQGESQPVRPQGSDSSYNVLKAHEETVTCDEYVSFIRDLAEAAYEAFPSKPVVVMVGPSPCADRSAQNLRKTLFAAWHQKGILIGSSLNNLEPDRLDASEKEGNVYYGWRQLDTGLTLDNWGHPAAWEYGDNPVNKLGDFYQFYYWTTAAGVYLGDFVLHHPTWNSYYTYEAYELIDFWENWDHRAWIIFRDSEHPIFNWSTGYGTGGLKGDYRKYLRVLNPQSAPQACAQPVRATATAEYAAYASYQPTPACPNLLPTPASTATPYSRVSGRQARYLTAGQTLVLALDSAWQWYGQTRPITITVGYLDTPGTSFAILVPGTSWLEFTASGSGLWQRQSFALTGTLANNLSSGYGNAFLFLQNKGSGNLYLHELFVDAVAPGGLGTPQPTATPTQTPIPLPSPTPVPDNQVPVGRMPSPPTLDGNLQEWKQSNLPSKTLTTSNADWSIGVSGNSDAMARLWAAWDTANLYLALEASDDRLVDDSYPIFQDDDALRLGLVFTDSLSAPVLDLSLLSTGEITHTAIITGLAYAFSSGDTWYRAEISIPLSSLVPVPEVGRIGRIGWVMLDDDDGGARDGRLIRWTASGPGFSIFTPDQGWGYLVFEGKDYVWDAGWTPTPTVTPSPTAGPSPTPTRTPTPTPFVGPTWTPTSTATRTPTVTGTPYQPPAGGQATWTPRPPAVYEDCEGTVQPTPTGPVGNFCAWLPNLKVTPPANTLVPATPAAQGNLAWYLGGAVPASYSGYYSSLMFRAGNHDVDSGDYSFYLWFDRLPSSYVSIFALSWPYNIGWWDFEVGWSPTDKLYVFCYNCKNEDNLWTYDWTPELHRYYRFRVQWDNLRGGRTDGWIKVYLGDELVIQSPPISSYPEAMSAGGHVGLPMWVEDHFNGFSTSVLFDHLVANQGALGCQEWGSEYQFDFEESPDLDSESPAGPFCFWYAANDWGHEYPPEAEIVAVPGKTGNAWRFHIPSRGASFSPQNAVASRLRLPGQSEFEFAIDLKVENTQQSWYYQQNWVLEVGRSKWPADWDLGLHYEISEEGEGQWIVDCSGCAWPGKWTLDVPFEYSRWYNFEFHVWNVVGEQIYPNHRSTIYFTVAVDGEQKLSVEASNYYNDEETLSWLKIGNILNWDEGESNNLYFYYDNLDVPSGFSACMDRTVLIEAATPTPGPTPTPIPAARAWISEIFPRQGPTCRNLNLREGCGRDDLFIEWFSAKELSTAGWRITLANSDCTYEAAWDSLTLGHKVAWWEDFEHPDGSPCTDGDLPVSGTVYLWDATGELIDSRDYPELAAGLSWQPYVSTLPSGGWTAGQANPGR